MFYKQVHSEGCKTWCCCQVYNIDQVDKEDPDDQVDQILIKVKRVYITNTAVENFKPTLSF